MRSFRLVLQIALITGLFHHGAATPARNSQSRVKDLKQLLEALQEDTTDSSDQNYVITESGKETSRTDDSQQRTGNSKLSTGTGEEPSNQSRIGKESTEDSQQRRENLNDLLDVLLDDGGNGEASKEDYVISVGKEDDQSQPKNLDDLVKLLEGAKGSSGYDEEDYSDDYNGDSDSVTANPADYVNIDEALRLALMLQKLQSSDDGRTKQDYYYDGPDDYKAYVIPPAKPTPTGKPVDKSKQNLVLSTQPWPNGVISGGFIISVVALLFSVIAIGIVVCTKFMSSERSHRWLSSPLPSSCYKGPRRPGYLHMPEGPAVDRTTNSTLALKLATKQHSSQNGRTSTEAEFLQQQQREILDRSPEIDEIHLGGANDFLSASQTSVKNLISSATSKL